MFAVIGGIVTYFFFISDPGLVSADSRWLIFMPVEVTVLGLVMLIRGLVRHNKMKYGYLALAGQNQESLPENQDGIDLNASYKLKDGILGDRMYNNGSALILGGFVFLLMGINSLICLMYINSFAIDANRGIIDGITIICMIGGWVMMIWGIIQRQKAKANFLSLNQQKHEALTDNNSDINMNDSSKMNDEVVIK